MKLGEIPVGVLPDTALCLFRITQEALRNVELHSGAKTTEVSLQRLDGGLKLKVTDTGAGFNLGDEPQRPSLGLASMRERARLVGGKLEIESTPGHGTTVSAWVPLNDSTGFFLGDRNDGATSHTAG